MTSASNQDTQDTQRKRDLLHKITVISRHLRNRFDKSVTTLGVTRSQWSLIALVSRNPGLTQRNIAERLEISEAAAGRLIDRLCSDNLLVRQPRPEDRRAYSVYLSDATGPVLQGLSAIAKRNEEIACAGLTEAEMDMLDMLLRTVYRNVTGIAVPTED